MIGDLYDADNVVVGQAAVAFAAANTPLPSLAGWNASDPFDPAFLLGNTVALGTSTNFTLTVTNSLGTQTTASLTTAGMTAASLLAALEALSNVGAAGVKVAGTSGTFTVTFTGSAEGSVLSGAGTGGSGFAVSTSLWTPCGATDQGWSFGANKSTQTINIEEQSTPVATTITSQNVTIAGALSEDITRTLTLALNATASTVAAGASNPGYDLVGLTDEPILYAIAMVTQNAQGFGRLVYAPSWTQLSNATVAFRRAAAARNYPVSFETVCKTSAIQVYNFTAPHS